MLINFENVLFDSKDLAYVQGNKDTNKITVVLKVSSDKVVISCKNAKEIEEKIGALNSMLNTKQEKK